jgi:UDP:flavonoid glycosyltransferase YjiC (YdhE family)
VARGVFGDVLAIPGLSSYEPLTDVDPKLWSLMQPHVREIRYLGPFAPYLGKPPPPQRTSDRSLYVSLGGAENVAQTLLSVLENLRPRTERMVVHTGRYVSAEQVSAVLTRPIGPKLSCFSFKRDYFQLLSECQVALIHGGHGTVYETLFAAVPSLSLPASKEQEDNAHILARLGMGIVASRQTAPDRIHHALDVLFDEPRYRINAARAAEGVRQRDGLAELARLIESRVL